MAITAVNHKRTQEELGQPPLKRVKTSDGIREIRVLLPMEIINGIFSYFKAKDMVNFERVCKQFYDLAGNAPMWKELCGRACLPKKDSISFRNQFLSELNCRNPNPKAAISEAEFFLDDKYIEIDLDRVIESYNRVIMNSRIPKEEKVEAIFKKAKMIGRDFSTYPFNDDCGAIGSINSQLKSVCQWNFSKNQVARAQLYMTIMAVTPLINSNLNLTFNDLWEDAYNQLVKVSKNVDADPEDRARAKLYIGITEEPFYGETTFSYFDEVRNNLKAFPEDRAEAVLRIAKLKVRNKINIITDSEAFQYLENVHHRDLKANLGIRLEAAYYQAFMIYVNRGPSGKNDDDAYRILDQIRQLDGWRKRAYKNIIDKANLLQVDMRVQLKTDLMTDQEAHSILKRMFKEGTRNQNHVQNLLQRLIYENRVPISMINIFDGLEK